LVGTVKRRKDLKKMATKKSAKPASSAKSGKSAQASKPAAKAVAAKAVQHAKAPAPKVVAGTHAKMVPGAPMAKGATPKLVHRTEGKLESKPLPAPVKKKPDFRTNDWVVYPAHGVGRIISVVEQEVAGMKLELFVINFDRDKMTLRVPVAKASSIGMRRLSSPDIVANALNTLKGRARIKRTMWSRRAQEYEAKINSGDLISIAEVVRDLHRASGQPEQSYSERQLYEAALGRMAREVAAVERIDEDAAVKRLETALQRAA
jgi:CarD family transcriptional regulator